LGKRFGKKNVFVRCSGGSIIAKRGKLTCQVETGASIYKNSSKGDQGNNQGIRRGEGPNKGGDATEKETGQQWTERSRKEELKKRVGGGRVAGRRC